MAIVNTKKMKGGAKFSRLKGRIKSTTISDAAVPKIAIFPLQQEGFEEVVPKVAAGDSVKVGQIIAESADTVSSPIVSSISGKVKEIKKITYFGGEETRAIFIENDGSTDIPKGEAISLMKTSAEDIQKALYQTGLSGLGHKGIPTSNKSSYISPSEFKHLIINAVNDLPYEVAPSILINGKADQVIAGIQLLHKAYESIQITLAISTNEPNIALSMNHSLKESWFNIASLKPKYPQGNPHVLIKTVVSPSASYEHIQKNNDTLVLSLQDVVTIAEVLQSGRPFIEKKVSVAGPVLNSTELMNVRIGTPIQELVPASKINKEKVVLVHGSVILGDSVDSAELPVERHTEIISAIENNEQRELIYFVQPGFNRFSISNTFMSKFFPSEVVLNTRQNGENRPCIYCGYCESSCPADIHPQWLIKYVEHDLVDDLERFRINECIECNLCTVVCPSKIQIADILRKGKELVKQED